MDEIKKAFLISVKSLRSCYTEEGILAGQHNFVDYWARDSFFASLGSIEIGDIDQVKVNLKLYIKHQKSSGHFPYRIISIDQFLKYLHFKKRFKKPLPNYQSCFGDKVVDQNLLFTLVAVELLKKEHNHQYLAEILPHLELSLIWSTRQDKDKDYLIEEGLLCNWMDHTKKKGKTLINNVLYYGAIKSFADFNQQVGNDEIASRYRERMAGLAEKINQLFWHDDYFIDWIDHKVHHYFDTAGNLFAVYFGLADQQQSEKILNIVETFKGESFIPKANYPSYRKRRIRPQLFLAGLADYGGYRIWIGSLYAMTFFVSGHEKTAKKTLHDIAKSILKNGDVYEIYNASGNPVRRWPAYYNEVPFAWSCGLFIWAVCKIYPEFKDWLMQ